MISIHVALVVRSVSDIETVRSLLAEHGRLSRAEPGCVRFEVFQSNLDPRAFFIVEAWESRPALETHRLAQAFTTVYAPQVLPLVDRAAHEVSPLPA